MLLDKDQSKQWNDEAIEYIKENELESVTVDIDDENCVRIFDNKLPGDLEDYPNAYEVQAEELLPLVGRAQFILIRD